MAVRHWKKSALTAAVSGSLPENGCAKQSGKGVCPACRFTPGRFCVMIQSERTAIKMDIRRGYRMRRAFAFLVAFMLLLAGTARTPAAAAAPQDWSRDAAEQFCGVWNSYYTRNNMNLYAGYILGDDNSTVKSLYLIYNGDGRQVRYGSGLIPPSSELFVIYDCAKREYSFRVISEDMKSDLQDVRIYAGGKAVLKTLGSNSHDTRDAWFLTVSEEDVRSLLSYDRFTLQLTIDGDSHPLLFSGDRYGYYYDMVNWLEGAKQYTDSTSAAFRSSSLLPEDARPAETPAPETKSSYSFREDLDGIDSAAQSVFYIEILDKYREPIGRASGFVAFDEHLLVTNQHVIDEAYYLQVEGEDGSKYLLDKVIISDKIHDIAILLFPDGTGYTSLELDSDSVLKRGQPVVTIGNPIGYRGTVAYGNISAFPVMEDYGDLKCIQFTAPTSHGSSGGCLFDDNGKVIGVTSAIGVSYNGEVGNDVGLAVPVRVVRDLYSQWDKKSYEPLGTSRSWDMVRVTPSPSPVPRVDTTITLGTMHWETTGDDRAAVSFDVINGSQSTTVESFELYLYATDAAGSRLYGDTYEFNRTTGTVLAPGKTVRSDKFVLPQWSRVYTVCCKIYRITLSNGSVITLDSKYDSYAVR